MAHPDSITLDTSSRTQMVDITDEVTLVAQRHPTASAFLVSSMHTTAAITINEGYDPDVATDILRALAPVADHGDYLHGEGNSDSHVKVALLGTSQLVPAHRGELLLGRWQRIFFCEFDGPRQARTVTVAPLAGARA